MVKRVGFDRVDCFCWFLFQYHYDFIKKLLNPLGLENISHN